MTWIAVIGIALCAYKIGHFFGWCDGYDVCQCEE